MVVLAFVSRPRLRLALAVGGGLWALGLIALQAFVLDAWCKLCMIADPAAIVLAALVVARAGTVRFTFVRAAIALPFAALPLAFVMLASRPHAAEAVPVGGTPAVIAREHVPGVVTVVEFVDFECPFCRKLAPKLQDAIQHAPAPVRVVRKMVPLKQHPHARDAALAWCCADAQGRGDEMAAALFAAPPDTLTPDGCEQLALQVGCDRDRYRATIADPKLGDRLAADLADAKAANIHGFPTVFIGDQRISGANHEPADLVAAIARAR
jgi:predicted DsbA family dithiol-disulfide isomerase